MDPEVKQAMQTVVDYLDGLMGQAPNRELADCSNYLQALLDQQA